MKKKRIGIFGGTFNPPHMGHIKAAKEFKEQMQLDVLLIVPSFIPPHKEYSSSVTCEERLEMCELAFSDIDSVVVSDIEIARRGKSYTYITLEEMYDEESRLFFLCGTDMILSMDTWRNPERIFALADICYIRREKDPNNELIIEQKCSEYKKKYNATIHAIASEALEISSTEIRESSVDFDKHLSKSVAEYISSRGLYQND